MKRHEYVHQTNMMMSVLIMVKIQKIINIFTIFVSAVDKHFNLLQYIPTQTF